MLQTNRSREIIRYDKYGDSSTWGLPPELYPFPRNPELIENPRPELIQSLKKKITVAVQIEDETTTQTFEEGTSRVLSLHEAQSLAFSILEEQKKEWADYVAEEARLLTAFEDEDE
ncbi:MAG: hypothetical protein FVQ80_18000 [Planctomycetes bacterium]|nr:hypothetical protein [Planctomycetota bacterium]